MQRTGLLTGGILMLLIGLALVIWGFQMEPTVGEAIGNVFDGDFTDKRNLLKVSGVVLCVLGVASLAGSMFTGRGASHA